MVPNVYIAPQGTSYVLHCPNRVPRTYNCWLAAWQARETARKEVE